jgi:tRNA threonylcarbamoyl adenosine modification protein YeaZ
MILLAYDCSGPCLSVVLYDGDKKMGELDSEPGVRHSTVLVPMIEKLLKKAGVKLSEVDVFAVGLGPGSFTGLRVGVATAKILGYVLKKKIVGVSSLEALAREALAGKNGRVAVALDARKSQVYGAEYERRGKNFKVIRKPALMDAKKFPGISGTPKASWVAEAALSMARQKKFIDPFRLEPLYLHPRDCNVTLPKK